VDLTMLGQSPGTRHRVSVADLWDGSRVSTGSAARRCDAEKRDASKIPKVEIGARGGTRTRMTEVEGF
jgi:hypothetical protein